MKPTISVQTHSRSVSSPCRQFRVLDQRFKLCADHAFVIYLCFHTTIHVRLCDRWSDSEREQDSAVVVFVGGDGGRAFGTFSERQV